MSRPWSVSVGQVPPGPQPSGYQKAAGGLTGLAGLLLAGFGLYYLAPIAGVWLADHSSGGVRRAGSWVANLRMGSVLDYAQTRGAIVRLAK